MMGSWCGKGKRLLVCACIVKGTVSVPSQGGASKGPAIRPCWTSLAISSAMSAQCVSVLFRWIFS